jgi:hypothetical protein
MLFQARSKKSKRFKEKSFKFFARFTEKYYFCNEINKNDNNYAESERILLRLLFLLYSKM